MNSFDHFHSSGGTYGVDFKGRLDVIFSVVFSGRSGRT